MSNRHSKKNVFIFFLIGFFSFNATSCQSQKYYKCDYKQESLFQGFHKHLLPFPSDQMDWGPFKDKGFPNLIFQET